MQPRNKFEKEVFARSKELQPINKIQTEWAFRHCFKHYAIIRADGTATCSECGKEWKSKNNLAETLAGCTCPHCGMELETHRTRKRVFQQTEYLGIITTFKGWQVLRFFYMYLHQKKGEKSRYFISEVVQRWINPKGKVAAVAKNKSMSYWFNAWKLDSDLEIRKNENVIDIQPTAIYPRKRVLAEIKRNGFKGQFHDLTPYEMFHSILTNSRAETLLKTKQLSLLNYFEETRYRDIEDYWSAIRICIRNGYNVTDASMWCDIVNMLRRLGKDIHNPKFVCPEDLKAEHDRRELEIRRKREKEEIKEQRDKLLKSIKNEKRFQELKSKFFGIAFTDGTIKVHVLESLKEYFEEATEMHHCLFSNEYYLKEDSLILSATINGKRIETIEVSLKTLEILQSRGEWNSHTEYHDQIMNLVKANRNLIGQRMNASA